MRTEIGNGEGSIYYNKQRKKFNAQYKEYDVEKGKYRVKTKSFKTEQEAKKFLSSLMYRKENPIYIEHNGLPLCELMRTNLKLKYDTNQISATQYARVLRTIESIERLPIGSKNIDEITSDELQEFMNSQKSYSNSSITKLYGQLNQTFKIACNKGYLMKNPMINVIKPRSKKEDKVVRALTVEEQQLFTEYLLNTDINKCKYKNVFLIQMYLGLRCGEALALTIHDIDLRSKRINISRTLTTDENGGIIMGNKTKTYAGIRTVPIPEFIYPYILEQMRVANNQNNNEEKLLFKPEDANYTNRANVNSELKRILKSKFNINDISTHSLRHSYGTRCIESGMAPVVVQRLMGHRDITVTLNTYTSVFDKFKQNEVDKVNKYYLDENLINFNILLDE